jgi:hypothetical protein
MEDTRNEYNILVGNPEDTRPLGSVDRKIILEWILRESVDWIGTSGGFL